MKKKTIRIFAISIAALAIAFCALCFVSIYISYNKVFSRCEASEYSGQRFIRYADTDTAKYPREVFNVNSKGNKIECFLYGRKSPLGLVVISCGHRCCAEQYISNAEFFVDKGWQVLCYDYTGCLNSEGKNLGGYQQSAYDLHAVLQFLDSSKRFQHTPVMLYGHSLGAYASSAVLQFNPSNVKAAISASGLNDPVEQWEYSVRRFTGIWAPILAPFARLVVKVKYPHDAHFTAIDGINSVNIPVLILQGTDDEYYGSVSSIYQHRKLIQNPNCQIRVMDDPLRHGHYDYLMSEDAVKYVESMKGKDTKFDLNRASEADTALFNSFNEFYLRALE